MAYVKNTIFLIVKNQSKSNIKYLKVWQKVFWCMDVNTDLRNRLSHNHLDICLRIREGVVVDAFIPDPVIDGFPTEFVA